MEKKRITDEELSKKTSDAIDNLSTVIKKISKDLFSALVEKSKDVWEDVFDKCVEKAKEKVNKKENDESKDLDSK